ncbi:hypothetical protein LPTSP3_g06840 [Leptospira kobayashii]|uniref:GST N-terminal domain-containing protein n=1 Tax=Leptospira kobayashii TaxID=1917830 RepID=A0ABN6KBW0_9LEPT|nr:glutathione S-transferase N-terminal domain-containing protein [Leptospira kobayashii]BDA77754.1 hypothetical protein LPTSP3_g06840 [Leptospira kobayashii]
MKPVLYTFPISHFSEKARWGLDIAAYDYELNPLVPGQHVTFLKQIVPDAYVPVLKDGDSTIQGSDAILDLVDKEAFGSPSTAEEREWETRIGIEIGKTLQTILYSFILDYPEIVGKLFQLVPPKKEDKTVVPDHFDLIAMVTRRRYKITPKNVDIAKQSFSDLAKEMQSRYAKSKFFNGTSFGRVDLTIASLTSAFALADEYPGSPWFRAVDMPESFISWKDSLEIESLLEKVREFYKDFRNQSK